MKLIEEIYGKDVGAGEESTKYSIRKATRAVVFGEGNKIAIISVQEPKFYKLPGGEVEKEENIEQALRREIKEETGCTIDIRRPLGVIIEYRDKFEQLQISYSFIAEVRDKDEPDFTKKEKEQGFELEWMKLDEAIELLEGHRTENYVGKFILERDLALLKEVKKCGQNPRPESF